MRRTTTRAALALALAVTGPVAAQPEPGPKAAPGSFTGARPPGMPGGLGGSNLGGAPAVGGGGLIGGPGMPGGLLGGERNWHCSRCQREVSRGVHPPPSGSCCGQFFVAGNSPPEAPAAPPGPAETGLPGAQPPQDFAPPTPAAGAVTPPPTDPGPAGNGGLIALGLGVIVTGLAAGGLVVFLALRGRPRSPARRRRAGSH